MSGAYIEMANLSKITIGAEEPLFPRQKTVSGKCVYKDIQKWGKRQSLFERLLKILYQCLNGIGC